MIDVLCAFMFGLQVGGVEVNGGKTEGRQGIDIPLESGGPGERGEELWEVARDLSRSKLNLSPSLLLQLWSLSLGRECWRGRVCLCPAKKKKVPRLQPYYKTLPKVSDFKKLKKKLSKFGLLRKYQIKKCRSNKFVNPGGYSIYSKALDIMLLHCFLFSPFNITIS